jgi:DNA-binding response OmpR family regulator
MVERSMLLEGEDPSTLFAEDARHWVNIYAQLLDFKRRILARVAAAMRDLPPEAAAEVEKDVELITAEVRRVEVRLAFWEQRHWELVGLDLNQDAHTLMYAGRKVYLTKREFQLLNFLAEHPNRYFTVSAIVGSAWHDSRLSSEQLRLYVSRLRDKLNDLGPPCRIDNKVGQGYGLFFATP